MAADDLHHPDGTTSPTALDAIAPGPSHDQVAGWLAIHGPTVDADEVRRVRDALDLLAPEPSHAQVAGFLSTNGPRIDVYEVRRVRDAMDALREVR